MKKLVIVCMAISSVIACDRAKNKNPITNVQQAAKDTSLQNSVFESNCKPAPAEAFATGVATGLQTALKTYRIQYRFQGANVTRRLLYFTGTDCSAEALNFEERGEFRIGDENKKTNDGGRPLDMQFGSVVATVISAEGVQIANAVQLCGNKDWLADGRERDVTGNSARPNCYGGKVPRQDANIYRVDGDRLTLGNSGTDSVTEPNRPASFTGSERFSKRQ